MSLLVASTVDNFAKLNYDLVLGQPRKAVCSLSSEYYLNLESMVSVIDAVLNSIGDIDTCFKEHTEAGVRESLVSKFHSILSTLLSFNRPDPLCLIKIVEAIISCCLFLKKNLNDIIRVYNYILPLISFNTTSSTDKDTIANLKRKAASALVKLAIGFSDKIMPYFTEISLQIQMLLSSSSSLGLSEKASLIEFLLVVVQEAGTDADRSKCYEYVFLPIVQEWQNNPVIINLLENFDSFRDKIGVNLYLSEEILRANNTSSQLLKSLEMCESTRGLVLYLCNVSLVVLKRLAPSLTPLSLSTGSLSSQTEQASIILLDLLIPRILTIIRFIHLLWNFNSWTNSSTQQRRINQLLELSIEEKRVLLSGSKYSRDGEEPSTSEALEVSLRIWLNNIRLCSYSIIGTWSNFGGLFIQRVPMDLFLPALFQDLTSIQLRFIKHLLLFVAEPATINCPAESMKNFLSPWLSQLVSYLGEYLTSQWNIYGKLSTTMLPQQETHEADSEDSVSELLVFERLLRQASHSMATYLFNIFIPLCERHSLISKTHSLETTSPLLQFIFSDKVGIDPK